MAIQFFLGDIRSLPFQDWYDFMFLPTGTISHLVTRSEVESFLAGAHRGLRHNGVLALDIHNPTATFLRCLPLNAGAEQTSFQHCRTRETIHVETTQAYHADTQILTVNYRYMFSNGATKDAAIIIKLIFPAEAQALLHYNGFDVVRVYGDYTRSEFNSENKKLVLVARKRIASS